MTNDLPSVGTEDARRVSFDDAMAMQFKLTDVICEVQAQERDCYAAAKMIVDLVSERDELASRVRELEGARDAAVICLKWLKAHLGRFDLPVSPNYLVNRIDATLNASKEHP